MPETDRDTGDASEKDADDSDLVCGDAMPCEAGTHPETRADPAPGQLGRYLGRRGRLRGQRSLILDCGILCATRR